LWTIFSSDGTKSEKKKEGNSDELESEGENPRWNTGGFHDANECGRWGWLFFFLIPLLFCSQTSRENELEVWGL